ncbi:hypothetical protein BDV25DRAFT_141216 [Aspergillus avenaceus]|uniref:Tubby C-terminal-like domain-containing protein n=1 Tax=Aspergillus avenaceus TaxID=36643 RepID=A0A5N6TRM3_ASPAV|nr:hypothetical protein BDV25DRAFT_141216 [Aspergillus avenaceus]
MSDTESTQSNSTQSTTTKPASQTFPLAYPPPQKNGLRLSSRLILQIQQLNSTQQRALPILDIYQPSIWGKSVGKRRKLTNRDIYIAQTESYAHLPGDDAKTPNTNAHVVGAVYTPVREGTGRVCFPFGEREWEVSSGEKGYRFVCAESGRVVEWEKRGSRPSSSGSGNEAKGERFALRIADSKQSALRRSWLATMTKKGLKVGGWDRVQRDYLLSALGVKDGDEDAALYTCCLTMGVYVASQEGWLNQYV